VRLFPLDGTRFGPGPVGPLLELAQQHLARATVGETARYQRVHHAAPGYHLFKTMIKKTEIHKKTQQYGNIHSRDGFWV
jgi:hypothetical protein